MGENKINIGSAISAQSSLNLGTTSTTYQIFPNYNMEKMISFDEFEDRIEVIYTERSDIIYTTYPPIYPERRVYKIIYSCIDGKWNKSDKIYGEIIPAQKESYEF